jgi:hypothetical protein
MTTLKKMLIRMLMKESPQKSFFMLQELDPQHESHAYLRRYKRARYGRWQPRANSLYELSALQACLLSLGRRNEVIALALAIRPLISEQDLLASEVLRQEVLSLGAYAARLDGNTEMVDDLLRSWGSVPFGWRSRTSPRELARYYAVVGTEEDVVFQGLADLHGAKASERLLTLCRYWLWLLTDHLILLYQLPLVEHLQKANITETMVLDKIAICQPVVEQLLELKRRESE